MARELAAQGQVHRAFGTLVAKEILACSVVLEFRALEDEPPLGPVLLLWGNLGVEVARFLEDNLL